MYSDKTFYFSHEKNKTDLNLASTFIGVSVFLFLFLILFLPSFTRYWAVLLLGCDFVYIILNRENLKNKIYLYGDHLIFLWMLFIIVSFSGLVFTSDNFFDGLQYIFTLILFLFNFILLIIDQKWVNISIKLFFGITIFFFFGNILQIFSPDILLAINRFHLSDVLFEQSLEFYHNGNLNGLTHQTLVNGLLISMLMGITFSTIYKTKKIFQKVILWIVYALLYYLLLMTNRRGFILFTIIILFFLIFRLSKKKKLAFLVAIILSFITLTALLITEPGRSLIDRTLSQADFTSGRLGMIEIMWNDFLENPFLGHGTFTTIEVVNYYHGHNIYFQVLRENGIYGFILLVAILLYNFVNTNIQLSKFKDNSFEKQILIFTLYYQMLFIMLGFTENVLYDTYSLYIYVISIAMSVSITSRANNNNLRYK